jgi:hypothetical protein
MRYHNIMSLFVSVIVLFSMPLFGQHEGHTQTSPAPNATSQRRGAEPRVVAVNDALKNCQKLIRDLEKAARPWDEAQFNLLAIEYERAVEDVVQSVDAASPDDRNYVKNLELADRTLARHNEQLRALSSRVPKEGAEVLARLTDSINLSRDSVLAQKDAIRSAPQSHRGSHGGSGHGCGSRGVRWLRTLLFR